MGWETAATDLGGGGWGDEDGRWLRVRGSGAVGFVVGSWVEDRR